VRYGGRPKEVLHPSAQARQYLQHLADGHTSFHDGTIALAHPDARYTSSSARFASWGVGSDQANSVA